MAAATPPKAKGWRWAFLGGLVATGIVAAQIAPRAYALGPTSSLLTVGLAGLLVGFGTRLGNGCTSGHGVCGISRGSSRSMAATVVFMLFGVVTVYGMKHGWAGAL